MHAGETSGWDGRRLDMPALWAPEGLGLEQERQVSLRVKDLRRLSSRVNGNRIRGRSLRHNLGPTSPFQVEEDTHEVLLAALSGLIPNSLLEQARTSLPKPEKPLTERMMQVQNRLDEEKRAVNSWREAVKVREASLMEGRKMLADHVTKMKGLQKVCKIYCAAQREGGTGEEGRRGKACCHTSGHGTNSDSGRCGHGR